MICKQNDTIFLIKLILLVRRKVRDREDIELDFESGINVCPPYKWRKGIEAEATSLADHGGVATVMCLEE